MKNNKMFKITVKNFLHGLFMAAIGAVISGLTNGVATGQIDAKIIGIGAASAGLGYIGKKLSENSNGEILTPETNETK